MITKLHPLKAVLLAPIVILFGASLASCSFVPSGGAYSLTCNEIESIPLTPLTSQWSQPAITDPGTFIAIHGGGGAILNFGQGGDPNLGGARIIRVEQSVQFPLYANRATVFLNGWRLGYSGNDHHVLGLGSLLGKIRTTIDPATRQPTLTWDVWGVLVDNAGKEGYSLTYNFTIVGWNEATLNAVIDLGVIDTDTALASFFSFIQNNDLAGSKTVAMLPRGFGFSYFAGWG
jgi:hypothetical protein